MKKVKVEKGILINILTRTSNRPIGFINCHKSIIKQTYKNVRHIVSYENDIDLKYLDFNDIEKVKVNKYKGDILTHPKGYLHAPYNLYCNELLDKVDEGWVLFLDDDDCLLHNKVLIEVVNEIKKCNNDTMLIWKMRYPNGKVLPLKKHFENKIIEINNLGSPCVIFHSKYKNITKWDNFKAADFRYINTLFDKIPNKKWIEKVYIQINNFGDYGKRNDIDVNFFKIFNKTFIWYFIPKYHYTIFGNYLFHIDTYRRPVNRFARKLKKRLNFSN